MLLKEIIKETKTVRKLSLHKPSKQNKPNCLKALAGKKYNFEVLNISAFEKENVVISSTKIREYLERKIRED